MTSYRHLCRIREVGICLFGSADPNANNYHITFGDDIWTDHKLYLDRETFYKLKKAMENFKE